MGAVSYSQSIATMAVALAVSTQYTNVTDTHPVSHRTTAKIALMHSIARQKSVNFILKVYSGQKMN